MLELHTSKQSFIIKLQEVISRTSLSRSTIYSKLDNKSSQYDPDFPASIKLGASSVGWLELEIEEWINDKVKQRDLLKKKVNQ